MTKPVAFVRSELLSGPHQRVAAIALGAFMLSFNSARVPNIAEVKLPRAEWQFVMPGMHQGYISWECFEANQRRLADNAGLSVLSAGWGLREGPALLQGRVLVRLTYVCQETALRRGGKICQTVPGKVVDTAVASLLIEMMTPMTMAVTLDVQREFAARVAEINAVCRQQADRMRYEAELARRCYCWLRPCRAERFRHLRWRRGGPHRRDAEATGGSPLAISRPTSRRGQAKSSARPAGGANGSPLTSVRTTSASTAAGREPGPPSN